MDDCQFKIGNDVLISWGCQFIVNNSHSIVSADNNQNLNAT